MSLITSVYDPFVDVDRFFDDALSSRLQWLGPRQREREGGDERALRPKMDVHEDNKNNVVYATFELPGLKKEDVNIDLQNNRLTISGESKMDSERQEGDWAVRERNYGKFSRTVRVPNGVKPEQIKASMENGVLTVSFPKTTPEQATKRIAVS